MVWLMVMLQVLCLVLLMLNKLALARETVCTRLYYELKFILAMILLISATVVILFCFNDINIVTVVVNIIAQITSTLIFILDVPQYVKFKLEDDK